MNKENFDDSYRSLTNQEKQQNMYYNLSFLRDMVLELQNENEKLRMRISMLRFDIDSFIENNKIDYKGKVEAYENMRKEAIEFIESMEYCGQEDYFYDNKTKDPCGNDNTFNDSKNKLLNILNKVGGSDE